MGRFTVMALLSVDAGAWFSELVPHAFPWEGGRARTGTGIHPFGLSEPTPLRSAASPTSKHDQRHNAEAE
ncbi:hypothetical protein ACWD4N_46840 [Streptomyces sp. NPDC002586]|uniref:hypothetical protein n=1 Tax=Streptomyces sp. CG4 TaxID=408783 RepID=UPI0034E1D907